MSISVITSGRMDLFTCWVIISSWIKVTDMSSINDRGENEFAYEESNIVGDV